MPNELLVKPRTLINSGFYTPAEASRIAHIPNWTLQNWKQNGIIIPTVKWVDEQNKEYLGHTFDTVVFMRLLRLLRERHISLFKSVNAIQQLKKRFGAPGKRWANAKIFADKNDAYVYEDTDKSKDNWGVTVATKYNQRIADVMFGEEFTLLKDRADALLIPSEFMNSVEIDPSIQNGLPIVLDTKILTDSIHKLSLQSYELKDIQKMYPFIPLSKIRGAEEYETYLDRVNLN
jgi:uncharacterized protein (DUF433 family)